MKTVKISFHPIRDGEVVSATILKQRKRADYWVNEDMIAVNSNEPGAERQILLDDSQRLVVEATSDVQVVYDKTQNAAVPRKSVEPKPPATPVDADGEELSPETPAVDLAQTGKELQTLAQREARDRAITEARERIKAQQQNPQAALKEHEKLLQQVGGTSETSVDQSKKDEIAPGPKQDPAHPTEPGSTVSNPPPPAKPNDQPPAKPTNPFAPKTGAPT